MGKITALDKRDRTGWNWIFALIMIATLLAIAHTSMAEEKAKDKAKENAQQTYSDQVKKYFWNKYGDDADFRVDIVDIQKTAYGPRGKLYLSGINTSVKFKKALHLEDKIERAKAIAQAFIIEEAAHLGIADMTEIRENKARESSSGTVLLRYDRYIDDLKLDTAYIAIDIDSDENIQVVNAALVPASPELYKAVKKDTINRKQARKLAEADMEASGHKESKISIIEKLAIPNPPYVIWHVKSWWIYRINAFTGEITEKRSGWIE